MLTNAKIVMGETNEVSSNDKRCVHLRQQIALIKTLTNNPNRCTRSRHFHLQNALMVCLITCITSRSLPKPIVVATG